MFFFYLTSTDSANSAAIEELKKQVNDIVQELNLLKEQQALQTGIVPFFHKCQGLFVLDMISDITLMRKHLRYFFILAQFV